MDPGQESVPVEDPMLQCASYALELLSNGGLRRHVIGALVSSADIELLYYDRSIVVVSERINFLHDHGRFFAMLHGMASLSRRQWGYETILRPPRPPMPRHLSSSPVSSHLFDGYTFRLNIGETLVLGQTIHHQHGLIGRGTCVVRAEAAKPTIAGQDDNLVSNLANRPLILKISWAATTRARERELVGKAYSMATSADEHRWVLDHLPNILHAEEIYNTDDSNQKGLLDLLGDKYEERELRIVVQEELFPITQLTTAADLAIALRGIFNCQLSPLYACLFCTQL